MDSAPSLTSLLTHVDWRAVLAEAKERDAFMYCSAFSTQAAKAEQGSAEECVFRFFADLCSASMFIIDPSPKKRPKDSDASPYPPWSLTESELEAAKSLLGTTGDAELEARLGDVLWIRCNDVQAAKAAAQAYLDAAAMVEDPENWGQSHERYKRALDLSGSVDRKGPTFALAVKRIEEALDRLGKDDPRTFTFNLIEDLASYGAGDSARHVAMLEYRGTQSSQAGTDPYIDALYLRAAIGLYLKLGQHESANRCRLAAAEAKASYAASFMVRPGNRGAGAYWLQEAIMELREVPKTESRQQELSKRLDEYQALSMGDVGRIDVPFEIPECDRERIQYLAGLRFDQAVRELACLTHPQRTDSLASSAQNYTNGLLFRIAPFSWVRADGRTDAKLSGSDPQDDIQKIMHHFARIGWKSDGLMLYSAIWSIRDAHEASEIDLAWLVESSDFVPKDRVRVFNRGLVAGFELDLELALHLLVPQVENSLRHLLYSKKGVIPFSIKSDRIQDERLLNWLLSHEAGTELLGADTVFALRGLLIERTGANIRHELAHGMIQDGRLQQPDAVYLWWLILRLCVFFEGV